MGWSIPCSVGCGLPGRRLFSSARNLSRMADCPAAADLLDRPLAGTMLSVTETAEETPSPQREPSCMVFPEPHQTVRNGWASTRRKFMPYRSLWQLRGFSDLLLHQSGFGKEVDFQQRLAPGIARVGVCDDGICARLQTHDVYCVVRPIPRRRGSEPTIMG